MAVEIARTLRQVIPCDSFGWVQEAEALRQLDRTEEAWNVLLPAVTLFPRESIIAYHLACYAARLVGWQKPRSDWKNPSNLIAHQKPGCGRWTIPTWSHYGGTWVSSENPQKARPWLRLDIGGRKRSVFVAQ